MSHFQQVPSEAICLWKMQSSKSVACVLISKRLSESCCNEVIQWAICNPHTHFWLMHVFGTFKCMNVFTIVFMKMKECLPITYQGHPDWYRKVNLYPWSFSVQACCLSNYLWLTHFPSTTSLLISSSFLRYWLPRDLPQHQCYERRKCILILRR